MGSCVSEVFVFGGVKGGVCFWRDVLYCVWYCWIIEYNGIVLMMIGIGMLRL